MTVLSLCTEAECGFQRPVSPEEEANAEAAVAGTSVVAAAGVVAAEATTAGAAAAAAGAGTASAGAGTAALAAAGAVAIPAAVGAAVAIGAFFTGKYIYKRVTWNNEAKKIEFRRQFVAHVTKKLLQNVDSTSANCSNQVEQ